MRSLGFLHSHECRMSKAECRKDFFFIPHSAFDIQHFTLTTPLALRTATLDTRRATFDAIGMSHTAPTRREFLQAAAATALTPLVLSATTPATPPSRRPWKWAPEPGLWETTCGDDVIAQLHAAADVGFAAFADAQLLHRPEVVGLSLQSAARRRGIQIGPACLQAYSRWTCDPSFLIKLGTSLSISGFRLPVIPAQARTVDLECPELRTIIGSGMREFKAMDSPTLPILIEPIPDVTADLRFYELWADIVHEASHPLCRLSADTYRLAAAGIDVVDYLHRHAAILGHIELADFPGGYEPGSGRLDIDGIVAATALSPHEGVIGLRCGLSQPSTAGLARLIAAARRHGGLREELRA